MKNFHGFEKGVGKIGVQYKPQVMKTRIQKRRNYLDPATVVLVKHILLGVCFFAVVIILLTIVWHVTRISALTIQSINIDGGVTINKEEVKAKVEEKLAGEYLRLVPRRFAFFYPEEEVFNNVNSVERIKNVQINRVSGTELQVTFDEYLPDSLWCDLDLEDHCFFLDENGYAFAKAPDLLGESIVRYYASERTAEVGVNPFTREDFVLTKEFIDYMAEIGWFVTKVEINSVRDVFYTVIQGSEIKATLTEEPLKPFENLTTILQSKEFSHLKPGNFQYIDLRFGSRVFVNEESKEPDLVEATTTEDVAKKVSGEGGGSGEINAAVVQD